MLELDTRAVTKAVLQMIENDYEAIEREVWQERPYTMVRISYQDKTSIGFSKVCYPDKWNAPIGINIATAKAAQNLAERLLTEDD